MDLGTIETWVKPDNPANLLYKCCTYLGECLLIVVLEVSWIHVQLVQVGRERRRQLRSIESELLHFEGWTATRGRRERWQRHERTCECVCRSHNDMWMIHASIKADICKGKGSFYIAQYPVRWTLHPLTDLFIPTPTRLLWEAFKQCSNYAQQLNTHISTTSIARNSFIQLSELGHRGENEKAKGS